MAPLQPPQGPPLAADAPSAATDGVDLIRETLAPRLAAPPDAAVATNPKGQTEPAEPATLSVTAPPGKGGAMDVAIAAEVLRRVNRTRQVVSLVSQVIIRSYEEEALHGEVCRFLVTFGGYLMSWVGLAEDKPEKIVRPVAHAGIEANFLHALKITWANDLANRSPTSRAILEQRPHVARNIPTDPRLQILRSDAKLYGYTATCALPLQFAGYGMGVLTIHASEPDAFGSEEVSLLRELANDLSAGVIALRERTRRLLLEERLVGVVDAAADSIIGTTFDGRISDWNQGATRLFGYSREEALGEFFADLLVPAEDRAEFATAMSAIVAGGRVARFEPTRRCKEGRLVHTSASISPIFGEAQRVIGWTIVEHDVTDIRAKAASKAVRDLEEAEVSRLKALDQARRTFMSEASHELNTPLTPLRIHVEELSAANDLTQAQRSHLVVIERNVLRLCSLVRDMLEASRLETGRFHLELAEIPLPTLIRETIEGLAEPAHGAGVKISQAPMPLLFARADRSRIGQVLYNLLTNAIGYTPRGGTITVAAERSGSQVVVRVSDTGVGLSPQQIQQLFQPFSRPHADSVSAPRGTGLGLFISKAIIEQHGGRVWAESKGLGAGSSFSFTLPVVEQTKGREDPGARGPESASASARAPPARVLRPGSAVRRQPQP